MATMKPMPPAKPAARLDRRSFLKVTALAGGGLMLGLYTRSDLLSQGRGAPGPPPHPNTYLTIHPDNTFTIIAKNPESGQGMKNALPMIIADEFDVDWAQVKVQHADLDPKYGAQISAGSTAIPTNYTTMRQVGATGRALMVAAAAEIWAVPAGELRTASGVVAHPASGRAATYASLAARAAGIAPPTGVPLKDPSEFKIIGRPIPGVQNFEIVTGQPIFSVDVAFEGMLFSVFEKCPVFGGTVVEANLDEIRALPGIRHAFVVDAIAGQGGAVVGPLILSSGVAIVADNWWLAQRARRSLRVTWDEGAAAVESSTGYAARAGELAAGASAPPEGGGPNSADIGDVDAAFAAAAQVVEAEYYFPLLAHAPLEPQNSTAHFKSDGTLEIWSPSQIPSLAGPAAAAGLENAAVTMHLVRAGGGFGRRLNSNYDAEVARIARVVTEERAAAGEPSVPVKLLWTREDDMANDQYRPAGFHYFKAGLDADGKIIAFRDFVSSLSSVVPANEFPRGFVPNFRVNSASIAPFSMPTGFLRAPFTNGLSFVIQSFIDELAVAAGRDPLQFRLDLLANPAGETVGGFNATRAAGVLEAVRDMSDWDAERGRLPAGRGLGVAFQFAHAGYVAYVVDVSVDERRRLTVHRVWSAVDVGRQIVNPSRSRNLVEGGFVEALSHLMAWEITIDQGRVQQSNFHQYPPTRMSQTPSHFELRFLTPDYDPTGLGEPALPPAIPAVCNAIFAATGVRIRSLPLMNQGYGWT